MRLLCGTDFSAPANDAATLAAQWSARAGVDLDLIYVSDPKEPHTVRKDQLSKEGNRLAQLGASIAGLYVVLGEPAETLIRAAQERDAGLIVLGATGQPDVRVRVARDAPAPVLAARQIEPLSNWLVSGQPLRVVTGIEQGESTRGALAWVSQLGLLGPVELTVVHLVVPGAENRKAHATGTGLGLMLQPEVERQLLEELRTDVARFTGDMPARVIIRSAIGRRDAPLVMEAQELKAGLLVVGNHQRRGLQRWWNGSVSHGVLTDARISVAVVPVS